MSDPMEVDPVDDGPIANDGAGYLAIPMEGVVDDGRISSNQIGNLTINITKEEEAQRAIEMLRGDDVAGRVAAANRLDAIAAALGEERTREVWQMAMAGFWPVNPKIMASQQLQL